MLYSVFGQTLKAARRKYRVDHHCRITQRDLALRAGCSEPTVSAIERGRCSPTLATARRRLAHLRSLSALLQWLNLSGCERVTDAGLESIREPLPRCDISR
jgi:DNA-binding XRE family transcriptional regulator